MKAIYKLGGNSYKDKIFYEIDPDTETIKAYYCRGIATQQFVEGALEKLDEENPVSFWNGVFNNEYADLGIEVITDEIDLSTLEEGDRFEGIEETEIPVDFVTDAKRENGELFVKLAWLPFQVNIRKVVFGEEYIRKYLVNVWEYEEVVASG